jgi:hypothetical protein
VESLIPRCFFGGKAIAEKTKEKNGRGGMFKLKKELFSHYNLNMDERLKLM